MYPQVKRMSDYTTTIGIEVHVELKTKSKMFCGCKNAPHESEPNANICPVCTAQPGTLPVVNKEAVKKVLEVGVAIGGEIAEFTEFDRKNYFYPDIPKAYQISQYAYPLIKGGRVLGVDITRIHLEEDTARSQHTNDTTSLVDFNRAGVPLMELVTEPVIHSPEEAGEFARELQLLLRMLGASDANMERGEMRVEANISVSKTDDLGTKVEVKNLNSFKVLEAAITFEVKRQIALLEEGGQVVQETRGWNDAKGTTYSQRIKETADDYRYFPDPDITKFDLSQVKEFEKAGLAEKLPKLATELRYVYSNLGLKTDQIDTILHDEMLRNYFQALEVKMSEGQIDEVVLSLAANYLTSDILPLIETWEHFHLKGSEDSFLELMELLYKKEIGSRVAKDLLPEVLKEHIAVASVLDERGLRQDSDAGGLLEIVKTLLLDHPKVVEDYKNGNENAAKFLVGQGMKVTKGTANPEVLAALVIEELGK